ELTNKLQTGEDVDCDAYAQRHPEVAERLRLVFPMLQGLASLQRSGAGAPDPASGSAPGEGGLGVLGDFRLIRQLGRGGMGVVYEAEQLSLNRRVALKVLPFAAALDSRRLQRFKTESLAAAALDHPHIVDVYGVGCERGVHYYAMRLIEGRTLAQVIADLRARLRPRRQPAAAAQAARQPAAASASPCRRAARSSSVRPTCSPARR